MSKLCVLAVLAGFYVSILGALNFALPVEDQAVRIAAAVLEPPPVLTERNRLSS